MNEFKARRLKSKVGDVAEVAKKLDIAPTTLYMIERGERGPGIKLAMKMCNLYKCTLDELFVFKPVTKRAK